MRHNKKSKRHVWENDQDGKKCINCGSRINNLNGFYKYLERDTWGVLDAVNWYPRCFPIEVIKYKSTGKK